MALDFNALILSHRIMREVVREGGTCIDATCGRGRDTAHLCELVGRTGRVIAFDIQKDAVDSTRKLLTEKGYLDRAEIVHGSHEAMAEYAAPDSVDCIAFNLGWLPGGDHDLHTKPESTIRAIEAGLPLLRPGGMISICIYYGKETGFSERDGLREWLPTVDPDRYTVLYTEFLNRPNNPPIPVFIVRERDV